MVLKLSYFVKLSLAGLSYYLILSFRHLFDSFSFIFVLSFWVKMREYSYRVYGALCRILVFSVASWSPNFTKNLSLQTVQEDSKCKLSNFTMELLLHGFFFRSGTQKGLAEFSSSFVENFFSAVWLSLTHSPQTSWRGQNYRRLKIWACILIEAWLQSPLQGDSP